MTCRKNHLTALKEAHCQKDHFFEGLQVNTPFVDSISNKNRLSSKRPLWKLGLDVALEENDATSLVDGTFLMPPEVTLFFLCVNLFKQCSRQL